MKKFISLYRPNYTGTLIYMLQGTEYRVGPYLRWWWRTKDFNRVIVRRSLHKTIVARLLLVSLAAGMAIELALGLFLIIRLSNSVGIISGGLLILLTPIVWAQAVVVPLALGRWLIIVPRERRLIARSKQIFAAHPGIKIAVAGSYGKTSMKELLATVLGEAKTVIATPGNKNVAISHAFFAQQLTGQEDIVIIEYGEGAPGDIANFAAITSPTHAVITGLAPAHLDQYKTLKAAATDIFSLAKLVPLNQTYVNVSAPTIKPFLTGQEILFDEKHALGYAISNVRVTLQGTEFTLKLGQELIELRSGLIGHHQVAPLAFAATFALQQGLTAGQVQAAIANTNPHEHRMQPYQLAGAWILDDTYNGNIEGIKAGTKLLAELPAKRKIYVTPGLVDQGPETIPIHQEMGRLIAAAQPTMVVLMANSVTAYIEQGLAAYKGKVRVETDPLHFYTNLDQFVAAGDLVLMQNDWTDNYA